MGRGNSNISGLAAELTVTKKGGTNRTSYLLRVRRGL